MISFGQYTEMHFLRKQESLGINQIAQKMSLNSRTVTKWLARNRYEARGFNAMPEALWDNEYYSPVPGANNGDTDIYLYNPHTAAIIVRYEDLVGSGSFTIPAR